MFTRDFKKFNMAVAALATAGILYVVLHAGFSRLATWTDANTDVYPFRQEDWLRYLLPGRFEHFGANTLLLVGESAVRENLLYHQFDAAFPELQVYQGAISLGTIDDVLVALDYLSRVYGAANQPTAIVLGITPRFVANLPHERPFIPAINRYSPYFKVAESDSVPALTVKTRWESVRSRWRFFLAKNSDRYMSAAMAYFRHLVPLEFGPEPCRNLSTLLSAAIKPTIWIDALACAQWVYTSPYKYHHLTPRSIETIRRWARDPEGQQRVWNPLAYDEEIRSRFNRLRELTIERDIPLYVVNLPEHEESLKQYITGYEQRYDDLIGDVLKGIPYLDLRHALRPSEFYDIVHATWPGAQAITQEVISFIRSQGNVSLVSPLRDRPGALAQSRMPSKTMILDNR